MILQRESDRLAVVAAVLAERGHPVAVARSTDEAAALVRERCGALLVDAPQRDCQGTLCSYVLREIRPLPAMVGVLAPEPAGGDEESNGVAPVNGEDPGDAADGDTADDGTAAAGAADDTGEADGLLPMAPQGALPGRESTPHPCHGCMVVLPPDTEVDDIAAAVEAAVRWWPGDA